MAVRSDQLTCKPLSDYHNDRIRWACVIENQKVETAGVTIKSEPRWKFEVLYIRDQKNLKFIPENLAETFPDLTEIFINSCPVKIINENQFKGLQNLKYLKM